MRRLIVLLCLTLFLLPALGTGSAQQFAKRGRTVYQAKFETWPTAGGGQGSAGPEAGGYALEATSNVWMGPGHFIPITVLPGDFILDVSFQVVRKEDCSLNLTLSDSGRDYAQLDFFLDLWQSRTPTFSIYENWVQNDFNVSIVRRFAERLALGQEFSTVDWRRPNTLAVRRAGNTVWFSLNGGTVSSVQVRPFPVKQLGVNLSFKSKVVLRSVVARVPS